MGTLAKDGFDSFKTKVLIKGTVSLEMRCTIVTYLVSDNTISEIYGRVFKLGLYRLNFI